MLPLGQSSLSGRSINSLAMTGRPDSGLVRVHRGDTMRYKIFSHDPGPRFALEQSRSVSR